ncbi:hypothetical protein [Kamptonema formosum]|uniref:hypothetical protein n=1 Tax=Kamptonema formosum TaxID=331992 RepID=UPI00034D14A1|nr:hypothetical protein [Oscillatoria sp. PCC 10802]
MGRKEPSDKSQAGSLCQKRVREFIPVAGLKLLRFCALQVAAAGWLAWALPVGPAAAASGNNYEKCASRLLKAGIAPETISASCGSALHPEELASCAVKINGRTDISAQDALDSCKRVRRPQELATCVVNISKQTDASMASAVLDNCRRSLLPERYSQCVVGLSRSLQVLPAQAMAACIDAGDRISNFDPSFVPQNQLPAAPPATPAPAPATPQPSP